jgi:acetate kinase
MQILVLNCGSSSIKYQLIDMEREEPVLGGAVERIGEAEPILAHRWLDGTASHPVAAANHDDALMHVRDAVLDPSRGGVEDESAIAAVGHRVVHGGEHFVQSVPITDEVEKIIQEYAALAPLHNPPNLDGIRAGRRFFPNVPHVAVFDTAFHQTMPPHAYLYALPYELYEKDHIRRYGFHGTSHRYVAQRAAELLEKPGDGFTGITCHLGNGCSIAAVAAGKSVDTSMGLTPLEGVAMGTRSGDVDPAIPFHLIGRMGMSVADVDQMLNRKSGLLGVSGVSNDLREVQTAAENGNDRAEKALQIFAYRIRKYIGAYLAVLGRADAVVFTGGIGENADAMRARILRGLQGLGMDLDEGKNRECVGGEEGPISAADSPIKLLVIPTREELLIARSTHQVVLDGQ